MYIEKYYKIYNYINNDFEVVLCNLQNQDLALKIYNIHKNSNT